MMIIMEPFYLHKQAIVTIFYMYTYKSFGVMRWKWYFRQGTETLSKIYICEYRKSRHSLYMIFETRCIMQTYRKHTWITRCVAVLSRRVAEVEDFRSLRLESIMHRSEGKSCVNELSWTSESRHFFTSSLSLPSLARSFCAHARCV